MDKKFAALATLVGVMSTLFAALAANGEKTLAVLGGIPKVLAAWSSGLPLGTGSWLVSVVLGTCLWLFLLPRLARAPDGGRAHLLADNIVIAVVSALVLIQQLLVGVGKGQLLMAATVGVIGGFIAPWVGRILRSAWVHRIKKECGP